TVRPEALHQLELAHIPFSGSRSKSWDEFAREDAPKMDFVFTVCDNATNEVCPIWPGQPMTAHWGVADPAAVSGDAKEIARAYRDAFTTLDRRISLFLSLPLSSIDKLKIQKEINDIGRKSNQLCKRDLSRVHWNHVGCNNTLLLASTAEC
ncbi:MAG TPA: hypothetical protein VLK33_03530, partial [Terriglobales bacterium]|nr:hypothetical protein [Terriglobales bacterium]